MSIQQDKIPDSTRLRKDSVQIQEEQPVSVFVTEESDIPVNYRIPEDVNRDLTPDWILYFSIASLAILAWLKLLYSKFIHNIFRSSLNYQLSLKIFNDAGLVQKRIFVFLNIFYYLTTGIFIYLVFDYFNYYPFGLKELKLLGAIVSLMLAYSLFRYLMMKISGYLFNRRKLFSEAVFHNFLYNKIAGIIIIPFILLLAYTRGIFQDISAFAGISVLLVMFLMRLIRLSVFILRSVVLIFYFILYLCSLEIIPLLVISKLLLSLSQGP